MDSGHNPYSQPCSVNSDTERGRRSRTTASCHVNFPASKPKSFRSGRWLILRDFLEKRYFLVEVASEGREVVVTGIVWPFSWRFLWFLSWLCRRLLRHFFSFRPHLHAAILHQTLAKLAIRNRYPAFIRQLVVNPDVGLSSGEHGLDFSLGGLHLDPADVSAFNLFFPHIGSLFLDLKHLSANILFLQHIVA
jgi:hypothetical protein